MPNFMGTLNSNEIFAGLYNMIISQQVFTNNISDTFSKFVDKARVDGSMYGDTKLYYSTDVLKSHPWGNDAEAANLLALDRPMAPKVQAIELDVFRQIRLTVDNYLSKRAWSTEGSFAAFNSVMLGWMRETKRIYDATLYNTYLGTTTTNIGSQLQTIVLPAEPSANAAETDIEAYNRIVAMTIAKKLADIEIALKKPSRAFNDYGLYRSFNIDGLTVVWNSDYVNKITKYDLPTVFHKDGLFADFSNVLPSDYFGTINTVQTTAGASTRSAIEQDFNNVAMDNAAYDPAKHVFPGDPIPVGTVCAANTTYEVDPTIAFKIYDTTAVPYMSAFEVGTSFFNARSLTENHYLTFGHNTLEYLKNFPFITGKISVAD